MAADTRNAVVRLALGQFVSWGTLFYPLTFLAAPIGRDTGWSVRSIFGGFTLALIVAGLASPLAGRAFLGWGARTTLAAASVLAGLGLTTLASAPNLAVFFAGWVLTGGAMSLGLYEGAFAALREFVAGSFRRSVVQVTLIGGFASTAFWPLTRALEGTIGWRATLAAFAALHLLVVLPLHLSLPRRRTASGPLVALAPLAPIELTAAAAWRDRLFGRLDARLTLLAVAFSAASFVGGGLAAHLAGWFAELGIDERTTLLAGMSIGPSQVLARALDLWTRGRWPWRRLGLLLLMLQTGALALLGAAPAIAAAPLLFAALFGASHGLLTIVRPLALEDSDDRSFVGGLFVLSSATFAGRAVAPLAFAGLRESVGARAALAASVACLALASVAWALATLRERPPLSETPAAPSR